MRLSVEDQAVGQEEVPGSLGGGAGQAVVPAVAAGPDDVEVAWGVGAGPVQDVGADGGAGLGVKVQGDALPALGTEGLAHAGSPGEEF